MAKVAAVESLYGAPQPVGALPSNYIWMVGNAAQMVLEMQGATGTLSLFQSTGSSGASGPSWRPLAYSMTPGGPTVTGDLNFVSGTRIYMTAPINAILINGTVFSGSTPTNGESTPGLTLWGFCSPFTSGGASAVAIDLTAPLEDIAAALGALGGDGQGVVLLDADLEPYGPLNPLQVDVGNPSLGESGAVIGVVTGIIGDAALEFTRPADTTAYTAQDVIAAGATQQLVLRNVARVQGGGGYITAASIITNLNTFLPPIRIYFSTANPPPLIADNSPFTLLYANRVGLWYVDLPALATGGSGSDSAMAEDIVDRLPFTCAPGSRDITIQLVVGAAATPASGQQFRVAIKTELY